jgi:nanoRNase/pAp phosphatase (c-di-AMP/oligoRNAs hydrolase)
MIAPTMCIYHHNCADGFAAAWAVWKKFPDIKFVPGIYGKEPPDCVGLRIFSLRSVGDFDVSAIAKIYGGGGHKNAAGFTVPIGWEGE